MSSYQALQSDFDNLIGQQNIVIESTIGIEQQLEIILISNQLKLARKNFKNILNQYPNEQNSFQLLKHRIGESYDKFFPHIYMIDEENKLIYMERMNFNLFNYVSNELGLSEKKVKYFFRQIFQAINQLHSINIIHGDIKLENILILVNRVGENDQNSIIKLCDLGHSIPIQTAKVTGKRGTTGYIDRILEKRQEFNKNFAYDGYKFDIFALGISLFESLNFCSFDQTFLKKINDGHDFWEKMGKYPQTNDWSEDLKQLFVKMVNPNENERWTINEILNSEWLKEGDRKEDMMDIEKEIYTIIQQLNHFQTANSEHRNGKLGTERLIFEAKQNLMKIINDHSLENLLLLETKREADTISFNAIRDGSFKSELPPMEILIILLNEGSRVASNWDQEGYLHENKFILNAIFEYEEQQQKFQEKDDEDSDDEEEEHKDNELITTQKTIQFEIKIWSINKQEEQSKFQSMVEFINTNKVQNDIFQLRKHTNYILSLIRNY